MSVCPSVWTTAQLLLDILSAVTHSSIPPPCACVVFVAGLLQKPLGHQQVGGGFIFNRLCVCVCVCVCAGGRAGKGSGWLEEAHGQAKGHTGANASRTGGGEATHRRASLLHLPRPCGTETLAGTSCPGQKV